MLAKPLVEGRSERREVNGSSSFDCVPLCSPVQVASVLPIAISVYAIPHLELALKKVMC